MEQLDSPFAMVAFNTDAPDTTFGTNNVTQSPAAPRTLENFKLFPKLPIELRFKIWMLSLQHRTIEMRFANNCRSTQYDFVFSKIPAILHVHKESRIEGLRHYKLLFGHKKQCRRPVYFNSTIDQLHLRDMKGGGIEPKQVAATLQLMPNKEDVRSLSIKREWLDWANTTGEVRPFLFLFPNLEQLRVCFIIPKWEIIYESGVGFGLAKHAGPCKKSNSGESCSTKYPDVQFTKLGSQIPEPNTNYGERQRKASRLVIRDFLERYKGGFWGNIDWKQPVITHGVLCIKNVYIYHCPYLGLGRAKAKRDAEATKMIATSQGIMISGKEVGQSKQRIEVEDTLEEEGGD